MALFNVHTLVLSIVKGHVRALLGLKTEASMRKVAKQAIDQGLSVRKVEQIVKDTNNKKTIEKPKEDIYVKAAKEKLMTSAQNLFAKMYEATQGAGTAGAGPDMGAGAGADNAQGSAPYGDDVVDGDYKEV